MRAHAKSKSKLKPALASTAALSVSAVSAFVMSAPASQAAVTCDTSGVSAGTGSVTANLLANNICEVKFIPADADTSGSISTSEREWTYTPPAGVSKISALVITAGGPAAYFRSSGNYAAGGGGGQVVYVDDIGNNQLSLRAGIGKGSSGWVNSNDGKSELINNVTSSGVIWYNTQPGTEGAPGAPSGNTTGGGNSNYAFEGGSVIAPTGGSQYASGAGQGGAGDDNAVTPFTATIPGGLGVAVTSFNEDLTLWATDNTTLYGGGGSILAAGGTMPPYATIDGTGAGGSVYSDGSGTVQRGAHGSIILRFSAATSTPSATGTARPYEGPIGLRQSSATNCVGDLATVTGSRLGSIKNIYVDGTDIPFTLVSDTRINFNVPNMKAGSYQLKYWVPVNSVNLTDEITIGSCSVAVTEPDPDVTDDETTETEVGSGELTPFYIAKRFTSYRGDRGAIVAADREAITAFIAANPGLTPITCVGSTSGQPASPTDQALAMARAENACSVVENLVPGITTRMVTSTGRGVGQFYRAVTLFGKGLREN